MTQPTPPYERILKEIKLTNLLSFGPDTPALPLENLNILIGPNGSGKSNLLEALLLLRAAPGDMSAVVRRGGGVQEWIWKGAPQETAAIEAVVEDEDDDDFDFEIVGIRHSFSFRGDMRTFLVKNEKVEKAFNSAKHNVPFRYYEVRHNQPILRTSAGEERRLDRTTNETDNSILARLRDPVTYPELTRLSDYYAKIRFYREWGFGRNNVCRDPQRTDMRSDRLEEDFSNLGLFLNHLRRTPKAKNAILNALRDLYEGLTDFDISVIGGTVQVFLTEGDYTIPASRLSDGTLRYLCLLAILCDPTPPPLICIEEPELGLHPDILPNLAKLLIEASTRTQLIITTHSEILVDAMSERPETIVVCEKHDGKTVMRRLDPAELKVWLADYRLGQLWMRGQLGGTRW